VGCSGGPQSVVSASKSFRAPPARESLFSAWPEKSNPKRGHPAWRFPGILPGKCVRYGLAFRRHVHVPTKRNRHRADSPAGRAAMPHRRTGGPGGAARILRALLEKPHQKHAVVSRFALAAAARLRIECEPGRLAALPGPLCGGETGATGRKADIDRRSMPFRRHTDVPSKSPPPAHVLSGHECPESAKRGAPLLGYFLFGHAKRK